MATGVVNAGPARDRAQAVMDGVKGSTVAAQMGAKVLAAYEYKYANRLPMTEVDGETVRMQPGDLSLEESAQFYLNRVLDEHLTTVNRDQTILKRGDLQGDQDVIDSQIAAVINTDL